MTTALDYPYYEVTIHYTQPNGERRGVGRTQQISMQLADDDLRVAESRLASEVRAMVPLDARDIGDPHWRERLPGGAPDPFDGRSPRDRMWLVNKTTEGAMLGQLRAEIIKTASMRE